MCNKEPKEKKKESGKKAEDGASLIGKKRKPTSKLSEENTREKYALENRVEDLEGFIMDNSDVIAKITKQKLMKYMFYKKYQFVTSKYQQIETSSAY